MISKEKENNPIPQELVTKFLNAKKNECSENSFPTLYSLQNFCEKAKIPCFQLNLCLLRVFDFNEHESVNKTIFHLSSKFCVYHFRCWNWNYGIPKESSLCT